jgi:hypothetical protein
MQGTPAEKAAAPGDVGILAIGKEILIKIFVINCNIINEGFTIDRGGTGHAEDFVAGGRWPVAGGARQPGTGNRQLRAIEMPARARHADPERIDLLQRLDVIAARAKQRARRGAERLPRALQGLDDRRDVLRSQKRIRIAERDELPLRDANGLVRRRREAAVLRVDDLPRPRKSLGDLRDRRIAGGVIDLDQLDVAVRLPADSVEAAPQVGSAVPGDQDDGDESSHRANALFRTPP